MSTKEGLEKIKKYQQERYIYIGGENTPSNSAHYNYWIILCRDRFIGHNSNLFPHKIKSKCECGKEIQYNCWIWNERTNIVKVIGSECINKFCINRRTCSDCGTSHRNIKNNFCNECRKSRCKDCCEPIKRKFKYCYKCNLEHN